MADTRQTGRGGVHMCFKISAGIPCKIGRCVSVYDSFGAWRWNGNISRFFFGLPCVPCIPSRPWPVAQLPTNSSGLGTLPIRESNPSRVRGCERAPRSAFIGSLSTSLSPLLKLASSLPHLSWDDDHVVRDAHPWTPKKSGVRPLTVPPALAVFLTPFGSRDK